MNEYDDNLDYDKIDFNKTKRGKSKNGGRRVSLLVIEGLILLVVVVAGAQFLFRDSSEVMDLQSTIESQNVQATTISESAVSAETLFENAMADIEDGNTDGAIRDLDFAIEIDPTYADAYFERGKLYYDQDRYFSASQDFTQAIEFDYDDLQLAYFWRGRSHFEWDDYIKAEPDFERVVEMDEDFTDGVYWRGRTRMELDNNVAGIEDVKRAIEMGYDSPGFGYFFIATAYDDLEEYETAIEYYDLSLAETSEECDVYYCWIDYNNRATSHYRLEQYDLAVEDYTKAIQVNPDEYPLAMQNRGDTYDRLGDMTSAMSDRNTMFQLIEGDTIIRSLSADSRALRATITNNNTQVHVGFTGDIGDIVTITLTVPADSSLNSMMLLRDPNGSPLLYSANTDNKNAQFEDVVITSTGTYTIVVASDLAKTSGAFELKIES